MNTSYLELAQSQSFADTILEAVDGHMAGNVTRSDLQGVIQAEVLKALRHDNDQDAVIERYTVQDIVDEFEREGYAIDKNAEEVVATTFADELMQEFVPTLKEVAHYSKLVTIKSSDNKQ